MRLHKSCGKRALWSCTVLFTPLAGVRLLPQAQQCLQCAPAARAAAKHPPRKRHFSQGEHTCEHTKPGG